MFVGMFSDVTAEISVDNQAVIQLIPDCGHIRQRANRFLVPFVNANY